MGGPYYTDYAERSATTKGTTSDPIPKKTGGVGAGRMGTYTHPTMPGKPRRVHKPVGRRVKRSMVETF